MAHQDRRFFSRILFDALCEIHLGDRIWRSQVLDISLHGALLEASEEFSGEPGDGYTVTVWLSDNATCITMSASPRATYRNSSAVTTSVATTSGQPRTISMVVTSVW